jgi:hypothetical protein
MSFLKIHSFDMRRVLFSQLKVGETYYECYTDSRDKFVGFDGYCAIFKQNVFFAYKKCRFYELIPFKEIVRTVKMNHLNHLIDSNSDSLSVNLNELNDSNESNQHDIFDDLTHLVNDALFFK